MTSICTAAWFIVIFCFIFIDSNSIVDFKDYLKSAVEGIPPYGRVFVAELNQKFLRAIRIDAEVNSILLFFFFHISMWFLVDDFVTVFFLFLYKRHRTCRSAFGWLMLVKRFLYRQMCVNIDWLKMPKICHRWQSFAVLKRYKSKWFIKNTDKWPIFCLLFCLVCDKYHKHICKIRSMTKWSIRSIPFTRRNSMSK